MTAIVCFLHDWQELAAGIIAVLAAISVAMVVESRERGRLSRQHVAARAVLPLALSVTSDYTRACGQSLGTLLTGTPVAKTLIPNARFIPPGLDPATIPPLRDAIEAARPVIGKRISTILRDIQILSSRLRTLSFDLATPTTVVTVWNINDYILNAAVTSARAAELFNYARGESDRAPLAYPATATIIAQLSLWGFDISTDPDLYELAEMRGEVHRRRSTRENLVTWLRGRLDVLK